MPEPKLTLGELAQIARLELRGFRRAAAGIEHQPALDRKVEAIYERARRRQAAGKQK